MEVLERARASREVEKQKKSRRLGERISHHECKMGNGLSKTREERQEIEQGQGKKKDSQRQGRTPLKQRDKKKKPEQISPATAKRGLRGMSENNKGSVRPCLSRAKNKITK